ncbi:hypothetical protein AN480_29415 [Mycobacterium intracellulare subsp. chimaera]|nr:hypothetical protein AN480_29415 [Mycobacterium intracellulare subsp. chimaera]
MVDGEVIHGEPAVERATGPRGIDPVGVPACGQFGAEFAGPIGRISQDGQRMGFFGKQFQSDGHFVIVGAAGFSQRAAGDDAGVGFYGHMRLKPVVSALG